MIDEEQLKEEIQALIKAWMDGLREAFRDLNYGTRDVDTPTFVKWFETKMREPLWYEAIEKFPKGRADIKRYNEAKAKEWDNGTSLGR